MLGQRREAQKYIKHTFYYIQTVKEFCSNFSQWKKTRETEIKLMEDIKEKDDKVGTKKADRKHADLQKKLDEVLKDTMEGLEELHIFLDAVEKLAVTSLYVFMENQGLHLPENIDPNDVEAVIIAARQICPLLLVFKRDPEVFFLPKIQNVEVLVYMLKKYLETTKEICDKLDKIFFSDMDLKMAEKPSVEFDEALSENDKQKMVDRIMQLHEIRMDKDFRMVFLFQEVSCSGFINEFEARQPKILKFLVELEECAVQLDRMCKGSKISSMAGSSMGAVGCVLSIVGLALSPVTAGLSLGMTVAGMGLGVTSGVNSAVTTATEIGVNHTNKKKANKVFQDFMEDIKSIQDCLEEVTNQPSVNIEPSKKVMAEGVVTVCSKLCNVVKAIDKITDTASAFKVVKAKEVSKVTSAGRVLTPEGKALQNVPKVAADVPDMGQAAVKGPLVLSKGARAGLIAVNAFFLGMEIFFIIKGSISLAKGSETKVSKFIRARAELWRSEINSWEKICQSLCQSKLTKDENRAILENPE